MRAALIVRLPNCDAAWQAGDGWYHPLAELFAEIRSTGEVKLEVDPHGDPRLMIDVQSAEPVRRFELISKFSCFKCGAPVGRWVESRQFIRWACDAHAADAQAGIAWRVACQSAVAMTAVRDHDPVALQRALGQRYIWAHWFTLASHLDVGAARTIARVPSALSSAMAYLDDVIDGAPEIAQVRAQLESAEAMLAVEAGLRSVAARA